MLKSNLMLTETPSSLCAGDGTIAKISLSIFTCNCYPLVSYLFLIHCKLVFKTVNLCYLCTLKENNKKLLHVSK
jgi:hypothetical protein